VLSCFSLTACEAAAFEALQGNAISTWEWLRASLSGATLSGAATEGKALLQDIQDLRDEIGQRVTKVGSGIGKLQEGSELIEEGVGGGE